MAKKTTKKLTKKKPPRKKPIRGRVGPDDLVVQTAIAFGNGADGMNLTPRATKLIRVYFERRFREHVKHYQEHRLAMLAYATGLGYLTKTLAESRRAIIIDVPDLRNGLDQFPCPVIPGLPELIAQLPDFEPF